MILSEAIKLNNHITHKSGARKTVCVSACLTALGVPINKFHKTGSIDTKNYLSILNRNGISCRSRKSKMPKNPTVGACRKPITKLGENCYYFVILRGPKYCHAILLNNKGETIVDTAPRLSDKRKVHSIHAVKRFI